MATLEYAQGFFQFNRFLVSLSAVLFTSTVTTALCTPLYVNIHVSSIVLILGLVGENDVRRLEPSHTCASLNDMADAEVPAPTEGHAPINIKVSSSTRVERPRCGG